MKRLLFVPLLLAAATVPAPAQTRAKPPAAAAEAQPTPTPRAVRAKATPVPVRRAEPVSPVEKKPGFFKKIGNLFTSGRTPKAKPTPAPAEATPTPTPAKRPTRPAPGPVDEGHLPAADLGARPSANVTPPLPGARSTPRPPKPVSTPPAPEVEPPRPVATPAPAPALPTAVIPAPPATVLALDPTPEADTAYQRVRKQAAQDPQVAALGQKLEAAAPGEAHQAAAREYAQALFGKMRELDPAQENWINRMEGATLRRINAGKPFVAE